jgi:hypothetical protein
MATFPTIGSLFTCRGLRPRVVISCVRRVGAGLVPGTRREVFERLKHLRPPKYPFVNLPEPAGPMGSGPHCGEDEGMCLGAIGGCRRGPFPESTGGHHRRHTQFVGLILRISISEIFDNEETLRS